MRLLVRVVFWVAVVGLIVLAGSMFQRPVVW